MKEQAQRALRQKINAYLSASPSRNISQLAKKAGVGEMTVRRIAQGECTASLETTLSLLKIVATDSEMQEIIKETNPAWAAVIEKVWGQKTTISDPTANESLKTSAGSYIINMVSSRRGSTRTEIETVLGRVGSRTLDSLIASGLLTEDNGAIRSTNPEFSVTDSATVMAQIRNLIEMYDASAKYSGATIQSESVNEAGLQEIQSALIDCANKISEIRQDPNYDGSIPFFFGAFLSRFESIE